MIDPAILNHDEDLLDRNAGSHARAQAGEDDEKEVTNGPEQDVQEATPHAAKPQKRVRRLGHIDP